MKEEVDRATSFVASLIAKHVSSRELQNFKASFFTTLTEAYVGITKSKNGEAVIPHSPLHWHPTKPMRGSAYRAVTVHDSNVDDKLMSALTLACGNKEKAKKILRNRNFPRELTLWVDPGDVSYRFGDHGSIGVVYSARGSPEPSSGDESDNSECMSSASSSPAASPPPPHPHFTNYRPQPRGNQCSRQAFAGWQQQQQHYDHMRQIAISS